MIDEHDDASLLRAALLKNSVDEVLSVVDQLNLQPSDRGDVLIAAPLRSLRKSRSVETFAVGAPLTAVRFLVELLSQDTLEKVVTVLGEDSENPSFDQLSAAVDSLVADGASTALLATMLAAAAANHVAAADHCRRLLAERDELALPDFVHRVSSSPLLQPRTVNEDVRAERRQRREKERRAREQVRAASPARVSAKKKVHRQTREERATASALSAVPLATGRREISLTPKEAALYSREHPLNGFVVEVDVEFDEVSTVELGVSAKVRPVVVVAGSATSLLVWPIFTKDRPGRVLLGAWHRVGLEHASYVQLERVVVSLDASSPPRRFGRLDDDEWNSLL